MKLITEFIDISELKIIKESCSEGGCKSEKDVFLEGPFLQAEVKNRNGRIYPLPLCEREVKKLNEEKISKNRLLGELDHPASPQINLDRVSHKIDKLEMRGNIGYGRAKLLNTPMGKIARALVDEGIVLGMSTRAVGTIDEKTGIVNDDLMICSVDCVADPSAPKAFVDAVMESKEWILQNGVFVESAYNKLEKSMDCGGSKNAYDAMMTFLNDISRKI